MILYILLGMTVAVILIAAIVWLLLYVADVLVRGKNKNALLYSEDYSLSEKEREEALKKLKPDTHMLKLFSGYSRDILDTYKRMNENVACKKSMPASAEWLLDNYYMIEEQSLVVKGSLKRSALVRLPVVKDGWRKGRARIFTIAEQLLADTEYVLSEKAIVDHLVKYQSKKVLFERELWMFPIALKTELIKSIRNYCRVIDETVRQLERADDVFERWNKSKDDTSSEIRSLFIQNLNSKEKANSSFVEHLLYRMKRSQKSCTEVQRIIEECLSEYGWSAEKTAQYEHNRQSVKTIQMGNCVSSLSFLSSLDWDDFIKSFSKIDSILMRDPSGVYGGMDAASQDHYKQKVQEYARRLDRSESDIAEKTVSLAKKAHARLSKPHSGDRQDMRKAHVGYYLIDDGAAELKSAYGAGEFTAKRMRKANRRRKMLYFGSITAISAVIAFAAAIYAFMSAASLAWLFALLAAFAVCIPASEIAVLIINKVCGRAVKPAKIVRLELKSGVPEHLSTIVAVPALLTSEKRAEELVKNLESHYLATRDDNVFFALIASCKDADCEVLDSDQKIINMALEGIAQLNRKYAAGGRDPFYFFYRARKYSEQNNIWIGWERKRGAILEFNELVLNNDSSGFSVMSSAAPPFGSVRYIITLDSDTMLPIGTVKRMIGSMAHPLNVPVIDTAKNTVIKGYGIMQPRIEIESESAGRSRFSRLFTGQDGLDPYSGAVSNVYQDLFAEGIFTGKGIYDVAVFQQILKNAFPENAILSHDLIEGSLVRTALVSELTLVDSYPSKIKSFMDRQHRWVRGDWQLLSFIFSKKKGTGKRLSGLSKWKMMDNLRRSMLAPAQLILFALSLLVLPGHPMFWLGCFLTSLFFPFFLTCLSKILPALKGKRTRRHIPVFTGIKAAFMQVVYNLVVLPYQAYVMLHAIVVTIVRLITKKKLLEWVTAADAEQKNNNTLMSYAPLLLPSVIFLAVLLLLVSLFMPRVYVFYLAPFFIVWLCSPFLAYYLSRSISKRAVCDCKSGGQKICDTMCLRVTARKTWRYFEEFADVQNHYLTPDNYQEDPYKGIAPRSSPTNIGLGLLAALAANDFGYITTGHLVDITEQTVFTIEKLKKWNGHLYNWYDTTTLKPLNPKYVSTVDSGNFVGYLISLEQGLLGCLDKQVFGRPIFCGLKDTLYAAGKDGEDIYNKIVSGLLKPEQDMLSSGKELDLMTWKNIFDAFYYYDYNVIKSNSWRGKINLMLSMQYADNYRFVSEICASQQKLKIISDDLPEILPKFGELFALAVKPVTVGEFSGRMQSLLAMIDSMVIGMCEPPGAECFAAEKTLSVLKGRIILASQKNSELIRRVHSLAARVRAIADGVSFKPLYDEKRKLFSIGYNEHDQTLSNSYYDMFASEARQASYIAVARGEVDKEHWTKLRRVLTVKDGYKGLVSWTGTMFEYVMPLLLMKNYQNTLLDETYSFVLRNQKKYGRIKQVPWGVSECGFNALDNNNVYQYKAIGVPWLGLKRGLSQDSVITPYATFLALGIDAKATRKNITRLNEEGLDSSYGYYEAADYTPGRRLYDNKRSVVRSYMAHHQGMILLAIDNCLHGNIMQQRFHADPEMNSARLLLQERVPPSLVLKEYKRKRMVAHKEAPSSGTTVVRELKGIRTAPVAHILTNGKYSVLITDRGTGFSKNKNLTVSRWRVLSPQPHGMFFYMRDITGGHIWSATYAPLNREADKYQTEFRLEKATFTRTDKDFITKTEVIVASEDNVEIRRITLKNLTKEARTVEVTGYFEAVIAPQDADAAHPAFSNLFVKTEYVPDKKCLIARRRPRSADESTLRLAYMVVADNKGDDASVQYETDRMHFLGRAKSTVNVDIAGGKPLPGTVGAVLDPVICLRTFVSLAPGKERSLSFVTIVNRSDEALMSLVDKYSHFDKIKTAFEACDARSLIERNYLNLTTAQIINYQNILSHVVFGSSTRQQYRSIIRKSELGQSSLWQFGISGDIPIVLLMLSDISQADMLNDMLKMQEYFGMLDLQTDLVILLEEEPGYSLPLHDFIAETVYSGMSGGAQQRSNVYILDRNNLPAESSDFLHSAACLILRGDAGSIEEQINVQPKQKNGKSMKFISPPEKYRASEIGARGELYDNGIGGFSADGSEYIIRLENGQNTPVVWSNVVANPGFGFVASESGGGYTFKSNSRQFKLTPWSNDVVSDPPGEVLYIRDDATGELFAPTALPLRDEEPYLIRHGYGYTAFAHSSNGTQQTLTQFVPRGEPVKISRFLLKNTAATGRFFTLTYYIQPVLGVDAASSAMHIVSRMTEDDILLQKNPYNEEFPGEICFMACSEKIDSYTGDGNEFFGGGDLTMPKGLLSKQLSGAAGTGINPCAAISVKVSLKPGEEREIVFLLGSHSDYGAIKRICTRYCEPAQAQTVFEEIKRFWKRKTSQIKVSTPDAPFSIMLNGRLMYQTIACRLWARSGFYQSGGAYGFRDQLQDSLALALTHPDMTKKQILLHAAHQFKEGDVLHWWHEPSGMGVRTRFSDDLLWLPYVTAKYVQISGDYAILNEVIPFLQSELLGEGEDESYIKPEVSDETGTLYTHCIRAIDRSLATGVHGLPLIGSGDWNDGMNTVGNKGRGESVWLGWFLINILDMFLPICKKKRDADACVKYKKAKDSLTENIEREGWDGGWYKRAFFDDGTPLGSVINKECMIDSISQSWAVISGAADKTRAAAAIKSAGDYLFKKDEGFMALLTPPFDNGDLEPGYIKGYVPGVRENGGQYTHAAVWMVIALCMLGEGDKAFELYEALNPVGRTGSSRDCLKYKVEPYVMAADVYAVYPHEGRGGWTWYTGAAGWMYRAGVEYILGFNKSGVRVVMNPCVPRAWEEFNIEYVYKSALYKITVQNPDHISCGVKSVTIDGEPQKKDAFELIDDGKTHKVIVVMGNK